MGRELDETGLINFRRRPYDPAVGRFIAEDPIGFDAGDANFYRFVANNPLNKLDPTGLKIQPTQIANTSPGFLTFETAAQRALVSPTSRRTIDLAASLTSGGFFGDIATDIIREGLTESVRQRTLESPGTFARLESTAGVTFAAKQFIASAPDLSRYSDFVPSTEAMLAGSRAIGLVAQETSYDRFVGGFDARVQQTVALATAFASDPVGTSVQIVRSVGTGIGNFVSDPIGTTGSAIREVVRNPAETAGGLFFDVLTGAVAAPAVGFAGRTATRLAPEVARAATTTARVVASSVDDLAARLSQPSLSTVGSGLGGFQRSGRIAPNKVRPAVNTSLPARVTGELPAGQLRTTAEVQQARNFFERNRQAAEQWWSQRNGGKAWPEAASHAEHPRPLKDGGDPLYIEPGYGGSAAAHQVPRPEYGGLTDFQRWGAMGGRPPNQ